MYDCFFSRAVDVSLTSGLQLYAGFDCLKHKYRHDVFKLIPVDESGNHVIIETTVGGNRYFVNRDSTPLTDNGLLKLMHENKVCPGKDEVSKRRMSKTDYRVRTKGHDRSKRCSIKSYEARRKLVFTIGKWEERNNATCRPASKHLDIKVPASKFGPWNKLHFN